MQHIIAAARQQFLSKGFGSTTMDGVAALWYIAYYNIVKPLTPSGRAYVHAVNTAIAARRAALDAARQP